MNWSVAQRRCYPARMTPSDDSRQPLDREARLANRVTILTLASLCGLLLALVTIPLTFQRTEGTAARVVASTPLAVGIGVGMAARAARGQLRVHREEAHASQQELGQG